MNYLMKLYRFNKAQRIFKSGSSTGHLLASTDHADLVLLHLAASESIAPHALEVEIVFIVTEGSATLTVGDDSAHLSTGDVAEIPAGVLRAWKNSQEAPCKILVIKQQHPAPSPIKG